MREVKDYSAVWDKMPRDGRGGRVAVLRKILSNPAGAHAYATTWARLAQERPDIATRVGEILDARRGR